MSHTRSIQHFYFPDRFVYHIPIYSEMEILKYRPIERVNFDIVHNHIYLTCELQKFPTIRIQDAEKSYNELR